MSVFSAEGIVSCPEVAYLALFRENDRAQAFQRCGFAPVLEEVRAAITVDSFDVDAADRLALGVTRANFLLLSDALGVYGPRGAIWRTLLFCSYLDMPSECGELLAMTVGSPELKHRHEQSSCGMSVCPIAEVARGFGLVLPAVEGRGVDAVGVSEEDGRQLPHGAVEDGFQYLSVVPQDLRFVVEKIYGPWAQVEEVIQFVRLQGREPVESVHEAAESVQGVEGLSYHPDVEGFCYLRMVPEEMWHAAGGRFGPWPALRDVVQFVESQGFEVTTRDLAIVCAGADAHLVQAFGSDLKSQLGGIPGSVLVGDPRAVYLSWLSGAVGFRLGTSVGDELPYVIHGQAFHDSEGKMRARMYEAMGDAALSLVLAEVGFDRLTTPQAYQEARSRIFSNHYLSGLVQSKFPVECFMFPAGVTLSTKVGANAFEATVGLVYRFHGLEPVKRFVADMFSETEQDWVTRALPGLIG